MDDKKPRQRKPRRPKSPSAGCSPELSAMLGTLSKWKPASDHSVLEAANRLAQAAREKIAPDLFKPDKARAREALAICEKLKGHTISKFNGIGEDHDYVTGAAQEGDCGVVLDTVHLFKRNRIGEWSVSVRRLHIPAGTVLSGRLAVNAVSPRGNRCPLHGYEMDTPGSASAFRELPGILDAASSAVQPRARRGKPSK